MSHKIRFSLLAVARVSRPLQWIKNLLCFAGIIFSGKFNIVYFKSATWTFVIFTALSSAVYILNDIIDVERDRAHPQKRRRPVASGELSISLAGISGVLLALTGVVLAYYLSTSVLICALTFLGLNALYCSYLKHAPIIDVLCIAIGFVVRLIAGVLAVEEFPTTWIALCLFFLALFIGFSKRRGELSTLLAAKIEQRPVLVNYTVDYLDFLISSSATATIITYALFASASGKNPTLVVTIPIVFYAVMHYKRTVMIGNVGTEPESALITDWRLVLSVLIWFIAFMVIWLGKINLFR